MAGRAVLVVFAGGVIVRLLSLSALAGQELDPDAAAYMVRAREFSFADPWAASFREPLWVALVKSVTAPFGYHPMALRVFTVVLSVAVLALAWQLFGRMLDRPVALLAFAFVAFNGQLVFLAPRGVREELGLALLLVLAIAVVRSRAAAPWASAASLAIPVGLLAAIRWELGIVSLVFLVGLGFWRRRAWAAALLAVGLVGVLMGPFLASNAAQYGDPLHHSSIGPIFCRNQELPPAEQAQLDNDYAGPPISWAEYYLKVLGPAESIKREAVGIPTLFAGLFSHSVFPIRPERLAELVPGLPSGLISAAQVAAGIFAVISIMAVAAGLGRSRHRKAAVGMLAVALLGIAMYASLVECFIDEYRHVAFTLPFLAVPWAVGILRTWHRFRLNQ